MLACSFDMSASNAVGLLCAFGSAIVFVSSNIFFKKIMPTGSAASHHKLDKLNLLFYSSSMAFLLMIPIWVFTDLPLLLASRAEPGHVTHPGREHVVTHSVTYNTFLNGIVHFAQNIIAFIILSSVSPVTYSIASLFKRVAVICIALVWFSQHVHPLQGVGIGLTFLGLWMYNNAKGDIARGETRRRGVEAAREGALPLTRSEERELDMAVKIPLVPAYERPTTELGLAISSARPLDASASPVRSKVHMPLHIDITSPPPITTDIVGLAAAHSYANRSFCTCIALLVVEVYLCLPHYRFGQGPHEFKDTIYLFMLSAVHHQPYHIIMLFIESDEDGERVLRWD